MMGRDHQVSDGYGGVVFVVYGDLGFTVRIEALNNPLFAYLGQTPGELMREIDRRRHQLRIHVIETRLFRRIAKHHALVASALLFKQALSCRDALRNVWALRFQVYMDLTGISTKTNRVHGVADV